MRTDVAVIIDRVKLEPERISEKQEVRGVRGGVQIGNLWARLVLTRQMHGPGVRRAGRCRQGAATARKAQQAQE